MPYDRSRWMGPGIPGMSDSGLCRIQDIPGQGGEPVGGTYLFNFNMSTNSTPPFAFNQPTFAYIADKVTLPAEVRHFNPVFQERHIASYVDNQRFYEYHTDPPILNHTRREFGFCVLISAPQIGFTPNWSSLCADLASSLNGSVACGSNIAVSVLEATKTIAMLRNPFNLLKPQWRKRSQRSPASALAKRASDVWLEGYYGWKSTYLDVKSVAKTIETLKRENPTDPQEGLETRLSVSQTVDQSGSSYLYPYGQGPANWPWSDSAVKCYDVDPQACQVRANITRQSAVARVGCHQLNDIARRYNRTQRLLDAFKVDGASVVDTLWELVPFSFVVDWFVDPLGLWKLPGAYARINGSDVTELGYSLKTSTEYTIQCVIPWGYPWYGTPWSYRWEADLIPGNSRVESTPGSSTFYQRWVGPPDWGMLLSSLTGSGLSTCRSISGLALGIQRLLL